MSIKRVKQRNFGTDRESDDDQPSVFSKKPAEPDLTWAQHVDGKDDVAFAPYVMKNKFEKGALVNHPKFGKGVVVQVEQTNVQILFSDGKKKLGHGVL